MDPDPDSHPDADPDPAIYVSDLQEVNKNLFFFPRFFARRESIFLLFTIFDG
jgi:hypothetical protein